MIIELCERCTDDQDPPNSTHQVRVIEMKWIHRRRGEDKTRVKHTRGIIRNKLHIFIEKLKAAGKTLDVPHAELDAGIIGHLNELLNFSWWFLRRRASGSLNLKLCLGNVKM